MLKISRVIKNILFILPMLICLLSVSNEQIVSANIIQKSNIDFLENQTLNSNSNPSVSLSPSPNANKGQGKGDKDGSGKDFRFGVVALINSFGVEIDGCYFQVEQIIDSVTGNLYCGTLIVFCQDSVEIYTGGSHCS
jgi:hypothetical protein